MPISNARLSDSLGTGRLTTTIRLAEHREQAGSGPAGFSSGGKMPGGGPGGAAGRQRDETTAKGYWEEAGTIPFTTRRWLIQTVSSFPARRMA